VANIPAGLLGKVDGVCGPYKFRRRKDGTIAILPRYPRDKRSPAQLAARRKFSIVARLSSQCYLTTLKPFWRRPSRNYNAFARSIQRSLPGFTEPSGVPRFYLGGEWELPPVIGAVVVNYPAGLHRYQFNVWSNPWLVSGDRIFVAVIDDSGVMRFTDQPAVWPQDSVVIGSGASSLPRRWYGLSAFAVRDIEGLYDILSQPNHNRFWLGMDYFPRIVPG
jgi:hypothetical protein